MASTIKVDTIDTPDNTGNITFSRPVVANIAVGSTLPAIDGSALTNIVHTPADNSVTGAKLNISLVAGDTMYASATDTLAKLAKGTDGEVMTLASGVPSWAAAASGGNSHFLVHNNSTTAATQTYVKGSFGFTPTKVISFGLLNTTSTISFGMAQKTGSYTTGYCWHISPGSSPTTYHAASAYIHRLPQPGGGDADFSISSWDAAGVTIQWTKTGTPATATAYAIMMFFDG